MKTKTCLRIFLALLIASMTGPSTWAQEASDAGIAVPSADEPVQDAKPPETPSPGAEAPTVAGRKDKRFSGPKTIEVIGRGRIYSDDVAKARDNAIADALQGVVEQAVCLVMSPGGLVTNFQLLSDQVLEQTQGFIHNYKVLTESKTEKHYRVVLQAVVSMDAVYNSLQKTGALGTQRDMPAVLLLLCEKNVGDSPLQCWWKDGSVVPYSGAAEKAVISYMTDKGLSFVTPGVSDQDFQRRAEDMSSEPGDEEAALLGQELSADVVILGKAVAQYGGTPADPDEELIYSTITARALTTNDGQEIAATEGHGEAVHSGGPPGGTEALTGAAAQAAQDLTAQIMANWGKEANKPVVVELLVVGIGDYADFVRFRRHLRDEVRMVKNVFLRSIKAGEAMMDVEVMGNATVLADEMTAQRFEGLSVNLLEVTGREVKLELVPDPRPGL
jgi:hypothetical protein